MYTETYNSRPMRMFQYTNTHREQEVPSANTRLKCRSVLNTGLFATSMYPQHVHHSVPCARSARKDSRHCPEEAKSLNTQFYSWCLCPQASRYNLHHGSTAPASCSLNQELLKQRVTAWSLRVVCALPAHTCGTPERAPSTNSPSGKSPEPYH